MDIFHLHITSGFHKKYNLVCVLQASVKKLESETEMPQHGVHWAYFSKYRQYRSIMREFIFPIAYFIILHLFEVCFVQLT